MRLHYRSRICFSSLPSPPLRSEVGFGPLGVREGVAGVTGGVLGRKEAAFHLGWALGFRVGPFFFLV